MASAAAVRGGPLNWTQALAIPVFMLAVAATWLIARASNKEGRALVRLLLEVQFGLLAAVLIFSVLNKPSTDPHSFRASIAAMLAVAAMACQYALLRLALPKVVSTAVMTGNLTNAMLSLMNALSKRGSLVADDAEQLKSTLRLLAGFLAGCLAAAVAIYLLSDWAWSLPLFLAALAIAVR